MPPTSLTKAMGECVAILKPLLGEDESTTSASVIIGTVKGYLHDIGKNLVAMMKQTVDVIVASGLRDQIKILFGGAPVTQAFADEIGADGFASDAGSASKLAKSFFS